MALLIRKKQQEKSTVFKALQNAVRSSHKHSSKQFLRESDATTLLAYTHPLDRVDHAKAALDMGLIPYEVYERAKFKLQKFQKI